MMPAPRSRSAPLDRSKTCTSQPRRARATAVAHPAMLPPTIPTVLPRIRAKRSLRVTPRRNPNRAPRRPEPAVAASYGTARIAAPPAPVTAHRCQPLRDEACLLAVTSRSRAGNVLSASLPSRRERASTDWPTVLCHGCIDRVEGVLVDLRDDRRLPRL